MKHEDMRSIKYVNEEAKSCKINIKRRMARGHERTHVYMSCQLSHDKRQANACIRRTLLSIDR